MAKNIARKFRKGEYIVYPTHGVGRVNSIETETYDGTELNLYVINFEKEKMTLRVPIQKVEQLNLRSLSSPEKMKSAFTTLQGRARVKRTMWSRRAQEYEAKINSGDPISIAEVVRDLHRTEEQPEQSYSERQIYESAIGRLARELAAVEKIDEEAAIEKLEETIRAA
jgi:CarD family transcriptional regulator